MKRHLIANKEFTDLSIELLSTLAKHGCLEKLKCQGKRVTFRNPCFHLLLVGQVLSRRGHSLHHKTENPLSTRGT